MIAFAAPNVIVRRQPVENPHKERIPHGASTDALGLSPAFPFRAQDRAKGQAGGWRKLGPRLSSMDPTLVKAGLQPPPLAAAALTRIGSIDSSGRQDFDGQERASRGPPTHSKKREPRTFPLDIQGLGEGRGKEYAVRRPSSVGFADTFARKSGRRDPSSLSDLDQLNVFGKDRRRLVM